MSDTINRRDAINALECDFIITGKENADVVVKTIQSFVDRIKALPPAQTIIHCKDCKHYNWGECVKITELTNAHKTFCTSDAFHCGYAKRREESNESQIYR